MKNSKQSITKWNKAKVKFDLHRQTAKIAALSSGNVSKYEFKHESKYESGKDVLPEKDMLEKATTMQRF